MRHMVLELNATRVHGLDVFSPLLPTLKQSAHSTRRSCPTGSCACCPLRSAVAKTTPRRGEIANRHAESRSRRPGGHRPVVLLCCRYCQALFTPFFFPFFLL